jgi:Uma2 family endonuclease
MLDWQHSMGTKTLMSVEEYLHTSFDGADREYLDGEVVERNMGNKSHGKIQLRLGSLLQAFEPRTGIFVVVEVRQKVTATRYRIPYIAVFAQEPAEELPSNPPLIAIEILSPDDRIGYVIPKLEEYRQWGVTHIWSVDPEDRKLFIYGEGGLHEVVQLLLPEYEIAISLADIFGAT